MERLGGGQSGSGSSGGGSGGGSGLPGALYLCTLICIWAVGSTESKLYGLHSAELQSGELIVPRRVHANGTFMAHTLVYHHGRDHRRHRRSVASESPVLHYQLQLQKELLHLELTPHNYFVAPHMIIERHRRDLRTRSPPAAEHVNCHFHGKVRGQPTTNVAISTCAGLVGHIKTASNEYFIEPSQQHEAHPIKGHPHVVFQRSSVKQKNSHLPHKKRRHKRKRKESHKQRGGSSGNSNNIGANIVDSHGLGHSYGHGHGPRISNCGTREPRRRMETRLEWQAQGKVKIQGGRKIRRHHQQPHTKFQYETAYEKPRKRNALVPPANGLQSHEPRTKRSISSPRHVETLIVADSTMVAFHKDVQPYLLTIMNMVSALYKDPSIGNAIEIVVVKILVLDEEDLYPELNLTQNAQKNLDRFCSWQHKLNTVNENDPHHHDVAILITRKNICGNNCMTLGLANVGGMCKPKQSCSVNEDNGIMLSHTITHELGHNFGMFHDTAKIGCHPRVGSIVHIMTPTFGADTLQVCWSNCSRKYITHFLDQGLGECLDDSPTPHDEYNLPEVLPGERYNATRQCRMQFNLTDDSDVGACSSPHEFCSTLWCRVNGECVTNMRPTAPGTSCGKRKWCQNGKCVRMEELTVVNGGWGNWSEWSECSRSCGGGVSIQQRECNNPVPANGGVFCIGERKRYKICRKRPCPENEPSFRAQQCARYDNVTYQGGTYKWLPFFDKNNPCKLFCTDVDDTIIANWGETVLDGTPCTLGTNNMCIDGICKKVGCDWFVDSDMQDDRCGVCGGTGDQCKPVKEVFSEPFNVTEGYVEIVTIPARARHIVIKELANSQNFLAVARAQSNHFYLNGDSLISMPGEFEIAGAESLYDRLDEQETIKIPQPIQHSIALYAIVRVNETNEGIYYEFTLPAVNVSAGRQYHWKLGNWTACTASCGGGVQYRETVCYENGKQFADGLPCWTHAKNKRPLRQSRACNEQQCPAHWWPGPWQFCPVTCRQPGAPPPLRRRSIVCLDQHDVVVVDGQCTQLAKPAETEPCEGHLPECRTRA
ncbi:A disintegrin and metalloproteinase with thrombospondin motifs 7 [Scaptodrosophila lebanonensis]|uniref:A disintegrin and metalloproteinase with thrombospondin motifs 7 n=1 Tax=Drosophila lebanonensis TaxID=7225 RepID=A0A6J2TT72_DROLE|nr:A disintegrin and metalloproteinase with thrombospondin motifs 7 [Scaptodrosophila lebanonensis]